MKGQDQWLTSADSDEFISAGALDLPVAKAFVEGGVHVVSVPIDYVENTRVLVEELTVLSTNKRVGSPRDVNG